MAPQRKRDVFGHRDRVEQCGVLKHESHSLANAHQIAAIKLLNLFSADRNTPSIRAEQSNGEFKRHALAGPALPQNPEGFTGRYFERHIFKHRASVEGLRQMFDADRGSGTSLPRLSHACSGNQKKVNLTRMMLNRINAREERTTLRMEARPTPAAPCPAV